MGAVVTVIQQPVARLGIAQALERHVGRAGIRGACEERAAECHKHARVCLAGHEDASLSGRYWVNPGSPSGPSHAIARPLLRPHKSRQLYGPAAHDQTAATQLTESYAKETAANDGCVVMDRSQRDPKLGEVRAVLQR